MGAASRPAMLGMFFCFSLYVVFFALGVADGSGRLTNIFEIVVGLPLMVALLMRWVGSVKGDRLLVVLFGFYALYYVARTSPDFVAEKTMSEALRFSAHGLLLFCAALIAFSYNSSDFKQGFSNRTLGAWLVGGGGVLAMCSLINYYGVLEHGWGARLRPLGEARHPIIGMYYYGLTLWAAMVCVLYARGLWRFLAGISLICIFLVFVFSYSRGPMLALVIVAATYVLVKLPWRLSLGLVVSVCLMVALLVWLHPGQWVTNRGTSLRPEIWYSAFLKIQEAPIWGHGNTLHNYVYSKGVISWHGHNIWISHAFWGGAVAVALLAAIMMRALWLCWLRRESPIAQVIFLQLLFANLSLLTDGNILLSGPGPLWIVFALPVGVAASFSGAAGKVDARPADA